MSSKQKIVLKKLKAINKIWHPESTLVFKSANERIVIGRYIKDGDDGEFVPLDQECIDSCDKWKFKYDESLIESEEEAEEESQEEAEEEEGETEEAEEEEEEAEEADEVKKEVEVEVKKEVKKEVKETRSRVETGEVSQHTDAILGLFSNLSEENEKLKKELEEKSQMLEKTEKELQKYVQKFEAFKQMFN